MIVHSARFKFRWRPSVITRRIWLLLCFFGVFLIGEKELLVEIEAWMIEKWREEFWNSEAKCNAKNFVEIVFESCFFFFAERLDD